MSTYRYNTLIVKKVMEVITSAGLSFLKIYVTKILQTHHVRETFLPASSIFDSFKGVYVGLILVLLRIIMQIINHSGNVKCTFISFS